MPCTTLLFDLDGTLLPLDMDEFLGGYFRALLPRMTHVADPAVLAAAILTATELTIQNEDARLTNLEVFQVEFQRTSGLRMEVVWPLFESFYAETFPSLRQLVRPNTIAREICRVAHAKGYRLVLATNPIFPAVAVRERMAWAGIDETPFDLVTTMEDFHFCKPNPKYFMEILDKLAVAPSACMMFGNDVQEDGVAGKVGMETFLVTDWLIDRGLGNFEFSHQGSLTEALQFVQQLPQLSPL